MKARKPFSELQVGELFYINKEETKTELNNRMLVVLVLKNDALGVFLILDEHGIVQKFNNYSDGTPKKAAHLVSSISFTCDEWDNTTTSNNLLDPLPVNLNMNDLLKDVHKRLLRFVPK